MRDQIVYYRLRMPESLHRAVKEKAKECGISMARFIRWCVEKELITHTRLQKGIHLSPSLDDYYITPGPEYPLPDAGNVMPEE